MSNEAPAIVLCNGAKLPGEEIATYSKKLNLDYLQQGSTSPNVRIGLPPFVLGVRHLPNRVLDLLELAAYVYCADRWISRGSTKAVEFNAWARSLHFVVKVRDYAFWCQSIVADSLSRALEFLTGDREYRFTFQPGHSTPPTSLFDSGKFASELTSNTSVILFSGGLDSLAGTIQRLEQTSDHICLVSHQSQPGTIRTQDRLVEALDDRYPNRLSHCKFRCNLKGKRAVEETQRTRSFLYTCIAYAIAQTSDPVKFFVYENGITSMNFPRREELSNARASRTTHPRTIHHLQRVFSLVLAGPVDIRVPFLWKTKTDVVTDLVNGPHRELLTSSVSCSKTFQNLGQATHCGGCSQCVDRRFAAYAAKADNWDHSGIYAKDIIAQSIDEGETRTTAVDFVRQAQRFGTWNIDHFYQETINELAEIVDYLPECSSENDAINRVWGLCKRHGDQVAMGMQRMRSKHDNLYECLEKDSLLQLISDREYLKNPVGRIVASIVDLVSNSVPKMFSSNPPSDENDLNTKINVLLDSHRIDLTREHPAVSFAGGHSVPDHGNDNMDLLIESKYVRRGTTPSKASEGMAADLTKYPQEAYILFLVYDPNRAIKDDRQFKNDFESRGRCTVLILR